MQVFKTALHLVLRSPGYLLVYIVFFGLLGLFMTGNFIGNSSNTSEYVPDKPAVIIIDRDNSEVSQSLSAFLSERSTPVQVPDNLRALQDATAQGLASYILIIPEGYGANFIKAAQAGESAPLCQTVINYDATSSLFADSITGEYLNALRISMIGTPDASLASQIALAEKAAALSAPQTVIQVTEQVGGSYSLQYFFLWSSYPLLMGISVLTGTVFIRFQNGELRRRNLSSPLSINAQNLQIGASCLTVLLAAWLFICLLAMLPMNGGWELLTTAPMSFLLFTLAALVFALVPLALGFLFSQIGLSDLGLNGCSNLTSLVLLFLSGIFMGGSSWLIGAMLVIARFTPTYWYTLAVEAVGKASDYSLQSMSPYLLALAVVLLFALAIFCVGLLVGSLRAQTASAGGNSAADVSAA